MTKLMTNELARIFCEHPIGSQSECGMDAVVIAKFYNPIGSDMWLITEAHRKGDGDWLLWGYVRQDCQWAWMYTTISAIESIELPFGLTVERACNLFERTVKEHIKEEDYYL